MALICIYLEGGCDRVAAAYIPGSTAGTIGFSLHYQSAENYEKLAGCCLKKAAILRL